MTKYSFAGLLVDVKAYNWHMSALPDSTLGTNYDGDADTSILVGTVVVPGTDTGTIDIGGADATDYLGVATETREDSDVRPLTYTWAGVVRVRTNNSAIVVGSYLKCAANGEVALADKTVLADVTKSFGRALEANGSVDGTIIMAYINMAH